MKKPGLNIFVAMVSAIAVSIFFSKSASAASYKLSSTEIQHKSSKTVELMQAFEGKVFRPNEFLLGLISQEMSPTSRISKTSVQILDRKGATLDEINLNWKWMRGEGNSFLDRKNGKARFLLPAYAGGLVAMEKNGGGLNSYEIKGMPDRCAGWSLGDNGGNYEYLNQVGLSRLSSTLNHLLVEKRCYSVLTTDGFGTGWLLNPTTLVFDNQNNLVQSLDRVESALWLSPDVLISRRTINGGGFNDPGPGNSFGLYSTNLSSSAYTAFLTGLSGGQEVVDYSGYMQMGAPIAQSARLFPKSIFRVDNFQGHGGASVGVVLTKGNSENWDTVGVLKILDSTGKSLFEGQIPFDHNNDLDLEQLKSAHLFGDVLALTAYGNTKSSNGESHVTNVLWLWRIGDKTVTRVDDWNTGGQSLLDINGGRVIYIGNDNSFAPVIKIFSPRTSFTPEVVPIKCPVASVDHTSYRLLKIRHLTQTGTNSWAFQAHCEGYSPINGGSVSNKDVIFQLTRS